MSALTAVAMSGGLDSSVAALLLARRQQPVVGLSMLLWDESDKPSRNGRCCGALDLGDARRVAEQVGIPHYTLRMDDEFRENVVDPFVDDYLAGRTPSPCVSCNTWVKFDLLLARARTFGAGRVATGHYARIVDGPEGRELHRAVDPAKDQSYFLFELDQAQLAASEFPLGELQKDAVRELAREARLVVADKGESMEICFVSGTIRDFVESELEGRKARVEGGERRSLLPIVSAGEPATLVDREGQVLGQGEPYYRYTVGQRRGLGIAADRRLYVVEIDAARNRVVVGDDAELLAGGLEGERLHWITPPADGRAAVEATVRIRSRHGGVAARIEPLEDGRARVEFAEPQRGVAPGQAAVFYRGSQVLGGCWIQSAVPTRRQLGIPEQAVEELQAQPAGHEA
ncbi:MAG: tRNA 2-thiouridine(34) synthase MnmA [Acidobacteriota bacterium]